MKEMKAEMKAEMENLINQLLIEKKEYPKFFKITKCFTW